MSVLGVIIHDGVTRATDVVTRATNVVTRATNGVTRAINISIMAEVCQSSPTNSKRLILVRLQCIWIYSFGA